MSRKNLYAIIVVVIVLAVFVLLFLWSGQKPSDQYQPEQEPLDQYQKYSDRLKEAILKASQARYLYGGLPDIDAPYREEDLYGTGQLVPVKGLDNPDAVPFLIDVLQNGPTWSDERLTTGVYPHMTRCLAALCLGATRDSRALGPLIEALRTVDPNEKREYVSSYAATGLGLLGDPGAVDVLIDALQDKRVKLACANALGRIGDMKAVKPLIEAFNPKTPMLNSGLHLAVLKITRMKLKYRWLDGYKKVAIEEFPKLGIVKSVGHFSTLWCYWWEVEPEFTEQRFEKYYREWKRVVEEKPQAHSAHSYRQNKMLQAGIPALPFLVEKVKNGDVALITTISELTNRELKKTATQEQCLEWWNKNKRKWLIPFEETLTNPASETQSGNETPG